MGDVEFSIVCAARPDAGFCPQHCDFRQWTTCLSRLPTEAIVSTLVSFSYQLTSEQPRWL